LLTDIKHLENERNAANVVIACDKREAFAQGSKATKQSSFLREKSWIASAEFIIGRAFARPVGSQ